MAQTGIAADSDGLDISNPDVTTPEEIANFRRFYDRVKGGSLPSHEFWLEFRPDVLKRQRARVRQNHVPGERSLPLAHALAYIHLYAVMGFEYGIKYEILLSQAGGATRAEILDTLAVAFVHAGPRGFHYVQSGSVEVLRTYVDPPPVEKFPAGWTFEPKAFDSGMDYTRPDATPEDMRRLEDWFQRTSGEVPRYVRFMMKNQPGLLKAYRNRLEHAIRDALPKQMLPYLMLQLNTTRGFADGIREAVLLGRGLGMTKAQLIEAIGWGMSYGGPNAVSIAAEAAGDVLESMS